MTKDIDIAEQEEMYEEDKEQRVKEAVKNGMDEIEARQAIEDEANHDPAKGPFLE
ncbi:MULTISPECIES: hypothetical protein [unclassified Vibrio]|uniref:hypothetical protein n=1 Tax=unclassified Vibrio TaxID=2614977 RepID=UPI0025536A99|nr:MULTISPECIES: hypothetical protein [unclassified Vibrio]EGU0166229.1 hypothetical protein [Vibrio parahaemolyticus]MDK9777707.1 hypothetical protein [Vibrio sp. D401a]MDK9801133.1 hypothetical protein [Vibrio sp. D406a]HCG9255913.1 hypothetical protein [Vibrio parahaemolyticus]HCM1607772.1 hypothetical protein [Vibrio parahaemolyticus]